MWQSLSAKFIKFIQPSQSDTLISSRSVWEVQLKCNFIFIRPELQGAQDLLIPRLCINYVSQNEAIWRENLNRYDEIFRLTARAGFNSEFYALLYVFRIPYRLYVDVFERKSTVLVGIGRISYVPWAISPTYVNFRYREGGPKRKGQGCRESAVHFRRREKNEEFRKVYVNILNESEKNSKY